MKNSQGARQRAIKRHYWRSMRRSPIILMQTDSLEIDPSRFQYKHSYKDNGDTGSLTHVKEWNVLMEGIIDVWLDPDLAQFFIVNGHNRLLLARRLKVNRVWCRCLPSKTWMDARRDGALINIGSGCGTVLDAAKFFRDASYSRNQLIRYGLTLKNEFVRKGFNIARLSDQVFDLALSGLISEDKASILGASELNPDTEFAIARALVDKASDGQDLSNSEFVELIELSKSVATEQVTELTLFGTEQFTNLLLFETATIQSHIKSELSKDKRALSTALRSKQTLENAGNTIVRESTETELEHSVTLLQRFERSKGFDPVISNIINRYARSLKDGQSMGAISKALITEIKQAL